MPFYLQIVLIIAVGCVWIWGSYQAEQWLETREKNPTTRLLAAAYMGAVWWLITLLKFIWHLIAEEFNYCVSFIEERTKPSEHRNNSHARSYKA